MKTWNKKKKIFFICMITWMIMIFMFSSQNGTNSSSTSGEILEMICQWFHLEPTNMQMETFELILRKGAHMFLYFTLGILSFNFFKEQYNKPYLYAAVVTVLYACSDEFHQLFVVGRSGQFTDVLIDSTGMVIGFIGIYLYYRFIRPIKRT